MKRSPIKRKSAIARRTRIKARRDTPRRSSRKVDKAHLQLVRQLPCCAQNLPGHRGSGPCEAHHVHHVGLGAKGSDLDAVPLHSQCHRDAHDARGPFALMDHDERARFFAVAIEQTRASCALLAEISL